MIGKTVGHYQIAEKLGEGGMGVVYKARDTHLDRFAALKVLPPEKVSDPERKRRFIQEAKAASALNHPSIITIYDIDHADDVDYIAMEYVAGKTLDELIPRKGMRLSLALKYAVQIADALARAHGAGIIHRDLKPSNVMVDEHGLVKVLDFGLAKLTEVSGPEAETAATRTGAGMILGTAAYMSPEQAEGKHIDTRSDVFSFGSMLYEMLTGQRAFRGDTRASTIASILREDPKPISQVAEGLPRDAEKIVRRCLRKDPEHRFQHMDDLRVALEDLKEESDSGSLAIPVPMLSGRSRLRVVTVLVGTAVLLVGWWMWKALSSHESQTVSRETPFTADLGFEMYPSFSPDGQMVVYQKMPPIEQWGPDAPSVSVMVKMVGTDSSAILKESAALPVCSPDGRWIAFSRRPNWFAPSKTAVIVMPRIGGVERTITNVTHSFEGGFFAWTPDSRALITYDREREGTPYYLVLVSLDDGEKHKLTSPPPIVEGDFGPALSPSGKILAFWRNTSGSAGDLYLLDLDAAFRPAGEPRKLDTGLPMSNWPVWTRDGKEIIFCSGVWCYSYLWRIRADGSGAARRQPFGGEGAFQPNIAPAGDRLVYLKHVADTDIWRVELLPSGLPAYPPEKFISSSRLDYEPTWSPDGRSIAFVSQRTGGSQIWACNSNGTDLRQLTSMESSFLEMIPRWSPNGEWIAFHADTSGNQDIYVVAQRGGMPRRLTSDQAADYNPQWSPDGKYVYFRSNRSGEHKLWKVSIEGGPATLEPSGVPQFSDSAGYWGYSVRPEGGGLSIWREPLGGGEPVMLIDHVGETGFAVSSKGVYYVPSGRGSNPWYTGVSFFEFASGKSIKIADLKPHLGLWANTRPSISPDGRCLLYTQFSLETNDLMLVENFR